MHFSCLIITKDFPTDSVLDKVLLPFNGNVVYSQPEEIRDYPPFMWDWWQVGGRWNGLFKLVVKEDDEKYRWDVYERDSRVGRLFRSFLLEKMREFAVKAKQDFFFCEEDFFPSMGSRDGFIYVDGASISDILNFEDVGCYCCIDADGNAFSLSSWNGEEWKDDDNFENKLETVIEKSKEYYACIVDLHD